jgi:hypothetical protein
MQNMYKHAGSLKESCRYLGIEFILTFVVTGICLALMIFNLFEYKPYIAYKLKTPIDYHVIDAEEESYLYVATSQLANAGNGLFTAITIYKDEIIAVFAGEILSDTEAEKRAKQGKDQYFIAMLNGSIMDSINSTCFAKYANDASGLSLSSFKNNSKITVDEKGNVCIVAKRKIKAGEEIFCAYGKRYWMKYNKNLLG